MEDISSRTRLLLGQGADRLNAASVAVFGLGGVGSYCAEALARAGSGRILLCDGDAVAPSNLNRQLCALRSTLGRNKAEVVAARVRDIRPETGLTVMTGFIRPETDFSFLAGYDYAADCIDDVPAKLALICACRDLGVPILSAMGCGTRLDPTAFRVTDVYRTSGCPLARSVRGKLRKLGVESLNVVFSEEKPLHPASAVPGSVSFVPGAAGLVMAGKIVRDLCGL